MINSGFFRPPYRLTSISGFWRNVRDIFRTAFIVFPRNVWRYRGWLANDQDWDWCYLAEVMAIKLDRMGKLFAEKGNLERSQETAKECRDLAAVIERLRTEDYIDFDRYWEMTEEQRSAMYDKGRRQEKEDVEFLGNAMKRIQWWWD